MNSAKTTKSPRMERVNISLEPDMYIIAGAGKKRLYVNSIILKVASPVFRAMFGPNFTEGVSLKSSTMHEQVLPEDEEETTLLVLAMLHHSHDIIPKWLPPSQLFGITRFAHKYDLIASLRPIVYVHCEYLSNEYDDDDGDHGSWGGPGGENDWLEMMATAYLFRIPKLFKSSSNTVILNSDGPVTAEGHQESLQYLPDGILDLLNEAQMDMRTRLAILWGKWSQEPPSYPDFEFHQHRFLQSPTKTPRIIDHGTESSISYSKRATLMDQMGYMLESGRGFGPCGDGWFKQGLTYNVKRNTVAWLGNLVYAF